MSRPVIRPMEAADLPAAAALEALSFAVPWTEAILAESLRSRLDFLWALWEDGAMVGYCNLRVIAGEGELMRIAVCPGCRGRGYGRRLMDQLVRSAREQGVKTVALEVRNSNQAARNLYKSYGFREEAVRRQYYTHPTEDAVLMRLDLD